MVNGDDYERRTRESPLVAFVVPLRSKQSTNDWGLVSALCSLSIGSLLNQTDPRLRVILVCNDIPHGLPDDDRILIEAVSFDVPVNYREQIQDIKRKIKAGLTAAAKVAPTYFMRVDADDFVHRSFVEHCLHDDTASGWYFNYGYTWDLRGNKMFLEPRFYTACGTAHIIRACASDFPDSLYTDDAKWLSCAWRHKEINRWMIPKGRALIPFPGRPVVRLVNTSVNNRFNGSYGFRDVRQVVKRLVFRKRFTAGLREQYSLPVDGVVQELFRT